jgi:hypothetical protein
LALRQNDERIDIDAEQLIAEADGEVRDADDRVAQGIDIAGWFAAHAAENLKAAQTGEHVLSLQRDSGGMPTAISLSTSTRMPPKPHRHTGPNSGSRLMPRIISTPSPAMRWTTMPSIFAFGRGF